MDQSGVADNSLRVSSPASELCKEGKIADQQGESIFSAPLLSGVALEAFSQVIEQFNHLRAIPKGSVIEQSLAAEPPTAVDLSATPSFIDAQDFVPDPQWCESDQEGELTVSQALALLRSDARDARLHPAWEKLTRSQRRIYLAVSGGMALLTGRSASERLGQATLFTVQGLLARLLGISRQTVVRSRDSLRHMHLSAAGHAQRVGFIDEQGPWWINCYDGTVFESTPSSRPCLVTSARALRSADRCRPEFDREIGQHSPAVAFDFRCPLWTHVVSHSLQDLFAPALLAAYSLSPQAFPAILEAFSEYDLTLVDEGFSEAHFLADSEQLPTAPIAPSMPIGLTAPTAPTDSGALDLALLAVPEPAVNLLAPGGDGDLAPIFSSSPLSLLDLLLSDVGEAQSSDAFEVLPPVEKRRIFEAFCRGDFEQIPLEFQSSFRLLFEALVPPEKPVANHC